LPGTWLFLSPTVGLLLIVLWAIWRMWPGRRAGLIMLAIVMVWTIGAALLVLVHPLSGWSLQAIAFAAAVVLLAWLLSRHARQKAEITRLRRIAEARADRVSVLSHEVRTPLAMIKGATDLLLEGKPGPLTRQQRIFLETISQNCERTIALAEDLLIQARIEAGLFRVELQPVDLKSVTRQVVRDMGPLVARQNQSIRLEYPQVLPRIHADPRRLRQVLTNLLHNASRHTSPGGHIYVSISENDQTVVVSVTDDGAGMSADERRKLFEKFSSGRPLGNGTGLGLVIVKQIVELHGGRILVDTSLGRGTTFLFTLPKLTGEDNLAGGRRSDR